MIGQTVKQLRMTKGLSQKDLAKQIGSTQSAIARLEQGEKLPSVALLHRIASATDTTLIIMFEEERDGAV